MCRLLRHVIIFIIILIVNVIFNVTKKHVNLPLNSDFTFCAILQKSDFLLD